MSLPPKCRCGFTSTSWRAWRYHRCASLPGRGFAPPAPALGAVLGMLGAVAAPLPSRRFRQETPRGPLVVDADFGELERRVLGSAAPIEMVGPALDPDTLRAALPEGTEVTPAEVDGERVLLVRPGPTLRERRRLVNAAAIAALYAQKPEEEK